MFDAYISQSADQYGVPAELIRSVIQKESGGNPYAVGGVGERGLMQLTPKYYPSVNHFNPRENIAAGTQSLAAYYKRFGNWRDALSYYNGGKNMTGSQARGYADEVLKNAGMVDDELAAVDDSGVTKSLFNKAFASNDFYQSDLMGKALQLLGGGYAAKGLDAVLPGNPLSAAINALPANRLGRQIESGQFSEGLSGDEKVAAGKVGDDVKTTFRKYGLWFLGGFLIVAGIWRLING